MNIFPRAKPTSVMVVPVVQKQLYRYAIYSRDCKHPIKVGTPRMLAPIPAANFESKHRCLLSRFYGICFALTSNYSNLNLSGTYDSVYSHTIPCSKVFMYTFLTGKVLHPFCYLHGYTCLSISVVC